MEIARTSLARGLPNSIGRASAVWCTHETVPQRDSLPISVHESSAAGGQRAPAERDQGEVTHRGRSGVEISEVTDGCGKG